MAGTIRMITPDAWQPGQKAAKEYTVDCRYYRYEQDGEVIHEIDVVNMIRVINGTDRLAEIRAAIGV